MKFLLLSVLAVFAYTGSFAQTEAHGLAVSTRAPLFEAEDQSGKVVNLQSLYTQGPVVVLFYRGNWCPYCNKELSALSDSLQLLKAKGVSVVAITPEAEKGISKTIEKTKATFPILYDKDVTIAKAYDVNYQVKENMRTTYRDQYHIDFLEINQQEDVAYLPVPAVYIINKEGIITYRFFETDYRKRPSVKMLLEHLQ